MVQLPKGIGGRSKPALGPTLALALAFVLASLSAEAQSSDPRMALDIPSSQATLRVPFTIAGWAIDLGTSSGTGVDAVHVWAFPVSGSPQFLGVATLGSFRSDIGALFGAQFASSGWQLDVTSPLPNGGYTLSAYAHSTVVGEFNSVRSVSVTIVEPTEPHMAIDLPADGATVGPLFFAAGWALDAAASSGTGVDEVHLWAFPSGGGAPSFLGVAALGKTRTDVGAVFGAQFTPSGWELQTSQPLPAGDYRLQVYAKSTRTGTFNNLRSIALRVSYDSDPVMAIDVPASGSLVRTPFLVAGWAIDRTALSGVGVSQVDVWAFPNGGGPSVFLGAANLGTTRTDVGAYYGNQFTNSGWELDVTTFLVEGSYDIKAYAKSTVSGTFNNSVTVQVPVTLYSETQRFSPSDEYESVRFGEELDASGDTAVAASQDYAYGPRAAYALQKSPDPPGSWRIVKKLDPGEAFAQHFMAVAISGDTIVVGSPEPAPSTNPGAIFIFERDQGGIDNWGLVAKRSPSDGAVPDDGFGYAVAIFDDTIVVGATGLGGAYLFRRDQGGPAQWGEVKKLTAPPGHINFARHVAVWGEEVVVSSLLDGTAPLVRGLTLFQKDLGGVDNWGASKLLTTDVGTGPAKLFFWEDTIVASRDVFERDVGGPGNWGLAAQLDGSPTVVDFEGDTLLQGNPMASNGVDPEVGAAYVRKRNAFGVPSSWGLVQTLRGSGTGTRDHFGTSVAIAGNDLLIGALPWTFYRFTTPCSPQTCTGSVFVFTSAP